MPPANLGVAILALLVSVFVGTSESLPSCLVQDSGCPFDQDAMIDTQYNVNHWEKCQEMCVNYDGECAYFVWYGPDSSLFTQTCVLFREKCDNEFTCTGCISGPPHCDTCGIEWACQTTGDNILEMIPGILDEQSCQASCHDSTECAFYSHYGSTHDVLPNMCILFSDCAIFKNCQESSSDGVTCHTGPKECRPDQPCKKNEALLYYYTYSNTPRTKTIVGYLKEQVEVLTMGCQANLTIMAVGGGAASGNTGTWIYYGGGGSGYVNVTTNNKIPYSSILEVNVGRGGRMSGPLGGDATEVKSEDGAVLVSAPGGKPSPWTGGDGFSGGGAGAKWKGKGGIGGSNGGDGSASDDFGGGDGTQQDVASTFDPLFDQFELVAGSGGFYDKEYGGGGGGIEVANEKITEKTMKHSRRSQGRGYGAGGSYSNGANGAVLIEVVPADKTG